MANVQESWSKRKIKYRWYFYHLRGFSRELMVRSAGRTKGIYVGLEEFSGYEIDAIELWIEGAVTSEGITKLFVSFEGKGGCKVTLKPSSP
jgi:hypothetical protein